MNNPVTHPQQIRARIARAGLLSIALWCAGCAVQPAELPNATLPTKAQWSTDLGTAAEIDQHWWTAFGDPTLNSLMTQAVSGNLNLQVLTARTDLAKVQIGQAKASLLPILNLGTRTDTTDISGSTNLGTNTKFSTGGDLLWELDVWGKARKGVEAQQASYQASAAEWRAGYLTMAKSVAGAYFQLRQTDQQLMRQRAAIARAESVQSIYHRMFAQGLIPQTQVIQQSAELNQLQAALIDLQRVRDLAQNALASLIGETPGSLTLDDTSSQGDLTLVKVPAGLPADVLARRPDIVAAQFRLLQAVSLEQQARLAQLPTIGLTGLGGSASNGLSGLLKTFTTGLSSVVQFPVFNPQIRARIPVGEAQTKVAEAQYRSSVMAALEEVENLLVTLDSRRQQQREFDQRATRLTEVQKQHQAQLKLGLISQLEILESQRSLLAAEQAALNNHWQILNDTVALFAAVGGGWDAQSIAAQ